MFSADNSDYYNDFYTEYNTNEKATTSKNVQPRLSLDSGLGLTNDSFYSDFNEHQLDITAANSSNANFSFQSDHLEASPPTKWARVRTPPNRKKPPTVDSTGLFSPPSRKRIKTMFSSPTSLMKSPESVNKSIRISSPSPFKVTYSKTPLKLSNNENVTGIHIGRTGTYYNKKGSGSASKRCLLTARPDGFTFLGSPNSDVLDFPLQSASDVFGTLPSETPNKINKALETGDDSMDYHQYAGMIETGRFHMFSKSTNEENLKKSVPIIRTASRNLLKRAKEKESTAIIPHLPLIPMIKEEITDPEFQTEIEQSKKVSFTAKPLPRKKQSVKDAQLQEEKRKEVMAWRATPFETPKKDVPLYSGRWLVISTGRTPAQQELFSDAKRFLRSHPRTSSSSSSMPSVSKLPQRRRVPTISRVTLFKHRYQSLRS
uniref:Uncharacterized protein n=1 Tax=Caenorhabditis japonica TaxID=281687 RepID=A0A8R1I3V4_CAEJA